MYEIQTFNDNIQQGFKHIEGPIKSHVKGEPE